MTNQNIMRLLSIFQEIFLEDFDKIDWKANRNYVSSADLYTPHSIILDIIFCK